MAFKIPTVLFLSLANIALAIPMSNSTDQQDTASDSGIQYFGSIMFHPEPDGRGTWGIIFSCSVTLFFCVWTAIHPNVFLAHHDALRTFYKVIWMVFALGQPEAILMAALAQNREARTIRKAWREKFKQGDYSDARTGMGFFRRKWHDFRGKELEQDLAMSEAFFVVMGGFVIDETTMKENWVEEELRGSATIPPPVPYEALDSFIRKMIAWWKKEPSTSAPLANEKPSNSSATPIESENVSADTAPERPTTPEGSQMEECPATRSSSSSGRNGNSEEEQTLLSRRVPSQVNRPEHFEPYLATLTTVGFLKYLNDGGIDRDSFRTADIEDKEKADGLAKLISGFQAFWFLVQIALRYAQKLPITLLEIHLLIQVLCSLAIYILWWSKPLDVAEPIRITIKHKRNDKTTNDSCPVSTTGVSVGVSSGIAAPTESRVTEGEGGAAQPQTETQPTSSGVTEGGMMELSSTQTSASSISSSSTVMPDMESAPMVIPLNPIYEPFKPLHEDNGVNSRQLSVNTLVRLKQDHRPPRNRAYIVKQATPNRPSTVGRAFFDIATYLEISTKLVESETEKERYRPLNPPDEAKSAVQKSSSVGNDKLFGGICEVALVLVVGLLHTMAWNSHFPSDVERLLWRISSIGLCGFSLVVVAITAFSNFHDFLVEAQWNFTENNAPILNILDFPRIWREILTLAVSYPDKNYYEFSLVRRRPTLPDFSLKKLKWWRFFGRLLLILTSISCVLCYTLCTVYITVESYIGIRNVPPDTFKTPSISDYWPHL